MRSWRNTRAWKRKWRGCETWSLKWTQWWQVLSQVVTPKMGDSNRSQELSQVQSYVEGPSVLGTAKIRQRAEPSNFCSLYVQCWWSLIYLHKLIQSTWHNTVFVDRTHCVVHVGCKLITGGGAVSGSGAFSWLQCRSKRSAPSDRSSTWATCWRRVTSRASGCGACARAHTHTHTLY